jgi:hypothetical protein
MKEALEEELLGRIRLALEAKMEEETELDEARIDFNRIMKGVDKNKLKTAADIGEADYKKGIYTPAGSKDLEKFIKDVDLKTKSAYMAAWTRSNTAQRMKKEEIELDEVTKTAMKRPVTYTGSDGHSHTKLMPVKKVSKTATSQDKIQENN